MLSGEDGDDGVDGHVDDDSDGGGELMGWVIQQEVVDAHGNDGSVIKRIKRDADDICAQESWAMQEKVQKTMSNAIVTITQDNQPHQQWTPSFLSAFHHVFSLYDGDSDGKLTKPELSLMEFMASKRLHSHRYLDGLKDHELTEQGILDKRDKKYLVELILKHGYDEQFNHDGSLDGVKTITPKILVERVLKLLEKERHSTLELLSNLMMAWLHDDSMGACDPSIISEASKWLKLEDLGAVFSWKFPGNFELRSPQEAVDAMVIAYRYISCSDCTLFDDSVSAELWCDGVMLRMV